MANPENIEKANKRRTPSERRENARKAGKASGESRRRRASLREDVQAMLDGTYTVNTKEGKKEMSGSEMMALCMMQIASNPKNKGAAVQAFNTIEKMLGQDVPDQSNTDDDKVLEFLKALKDG